MRVFISHSKTDEEFVTRLARDLQGQGIEPVYDDVVLQPGDNWIEKLQAALLDADAFVVVLSRESVASRNVQNEVSTALFGSQKPIFPLLIEDCDVPTYLAKYVWIDFRPSYAAAVKALIDVIFAMAAEGGPRVEPPREVETRDQVMRHVTEAYDSGDLTLVCGAGISMNGGLPDWNTLLAGLLTDMFSMDTPDVERATRLASRLQADAQLSTLIVAQHLKSTFQEAFIPKLRDALYRNERVDQRSDVVAAVADLCRPRRGQSHLRSVVTFNFDDLLERALTEQRIDHLPMFEDGQRSDPRAIPVYHVHGYLPRDEDVPASSDVVFAEEAYHTQFSDPFSWSNLVQLMELTQSTCLFVGISLSDPNMRRLLDVASRKNGQQKRHYLIRKRPSAPAGDHEASEFAERVAVLDEQDASRLGFSMIWVDTYDEIPGLLRSIRSSPGGRASASGDQLPAGEPGPAKMPDLRTARP